jgi:hypothetical protein
MKKRERQEEKRRNPFVFSLRKVPAEDVRMRGRVLGRGSRGQGKVREAQREGREGARGLGEPHRVAGRRKGNIH